MASLDGSIALVTGSSRGIGAAIARLFAAHGAAVAIHGRDGAALAAVETEITGAGGRAISVSGDVTRAVDVDAMRARIESTLGPIDVLVANAGANPTPPAPLDAMTEESWRAAVDVNLTATFLTIKSVLPGMKERRRGAIVTMSSAAARRPTAYSPIAYAAAKAGIQTLTRALALQAGPYGIRVNCVAPETILTERNMRQIPEATQRALIEQHPIQRLGTPDDVARAALFLASDDAAWITGAIIDVAGGSVLA